MVEGVAVDFLLFDLRVLRCVVACGTVAPLVMIVPPPAAPLVMPVGGVGAVLPGCVPVMGVVPVAGLGAVLPGWLPAVVGPGLAAPVTPVSAPLEGVALGWPGAPGIDGVVVLPGIVGVGAVVVGMPGLGVEAPGMVELGEAAPGLAVAPPLVPPELPLVWACAESAASDRASAAMVFFMGIFLGCLQR